MRAYLRAAPNGLSVRASPGNCLRPFCCLVSQTCGTAIANQNITGISELSLRMRRRRDMYFEPGSV